VVGYDPSGPVAFKGGGPWRLFVEAPGGRCDNGGLKLEERMPDTILIPFLIPFGQGGLNKVMNLLIILSI